MKPWEVLVKTKDDWQKGLLHWTADGAVVEQDSGGEITSKALVKINNEAIVDEEGKTSVHQGEEYIIRLEPILSRDGTFTRVLDKSPDSSMYPPDTNLWYTRMLRGNDIVTYFLFSVKESSKYYLAIVQDDHLVQAHAIRQYEAGALRYETDAEIWREGRTQAAPDFDALAILDEPRPDWECIARLTHGVRATARGKTVGEAFDVLVPSQWPAQVRREIKAFLAYICKGRPDEDPLDFFPRFQRYRTLYGLLLDHYRNLIRSDYTLPYVRWMWQAQAQQLRIGNLAIPEEAELHPWSIFNFHVFNRTLALERATKITEKLNESGKILTHLPISREEAQESRDAWIERMWMLAMGLRIWPHVRAQVLGLQEVVYVGRAQRWPHKHLRFMARVSDASKSHRYFHHLMMPPVAFQKIKTPIRDTSRIAFSAYSTNYQLYNRENMQWKIDLQSLGSRENLSLEDLKYRFGRSKHGFIGPLSKTQAAILDYIVSQGYLAAMEIYRGIPGSDIDQDTLERYLTFMRDGGALDVTYRVSAYGLPTTFLEVHGEEPAVCSLVASLLESLPTCWSFIGDRGYRAYILARFDPRYGDALLESISSPDYKVGISSVSAVKAFTHRFYQRLLTERGEWDADVSELLSQKLL